MRSRTLDQRKALSLVNLGDVSDWPVVAVREKLPRASWPRPARGRRRRWDAETVARRWSPATMQVAPPSVATN